MNTNELSYIRYFIVLPNGYNNNVNSGSTIFNRFNLIYLKCIPLLRTITKLPAHFQELCAPWPLADNLFNPYTDYNIDLIDEDTLLEDEFIEFSNKFLTCFFVLEDVKEDTILRIKDKIKDAAIIVNDIGKYSNSYFLLNNKDDNIISLILNKISRRIELDLTSLGWVNLLNNKNIAEIEGVETQNKRYLFPLLCSLDRIRGLYDAMGSNVKIGKKINHSNSEEIKDFFQNGEKQADDEIIRLTKKILVEKYIIFLNKMITLYPEDELSYKIICERIGIEFELIKELTKDIRSLNENYHKIANNLYSNLENFNEVKLTSDFILCVPSVHYDMINQYNNNLKKRQLPKKFFRAIYDMNQYNYIIPSDLFDSNDPQINEENYDILHSFIYQRTEENELMTSSFLLYALGRRLPFIRTRNIPAQAFYLKAKALIEYNSSNDYKRFKNAQKEITKSINNAIIKEISKLVTEHGEHIKVISDLPVEWAVLNKLPLCIEKSISRIPLTPGDGLFTHATYMRSGYELSKSEFKLLIVNGLSLDDELYTYGQSIRNYVSNTFSNQSISFKYVEVSSREEFISIINDYCPTMMIYYGHGKYDSTRNVGTLELKGKNVLASDILELKWVPPIVVLGGCETQVVNGNDRNIGHSFLQRGAISVIGTFFSIIGLEMYDFIISLLNGLLKYWGENNGDDHTRRWNDILLMAFRKQYLMEPIYAINDKLNSRRQNLFNYLTEDPLELLLQYCEEENISSEEMFENRNNIYIEILKNYPYLQRILRNIIDRDGVMPKSLFFTSLGSPEKIVFVD